jgi:predicted ATPase
MKRYALFGGASSGKSSIILYLEYYCNQFVISESPESVIRLMQAEGYEKPWLHKDIQRRILALHRKRETILENLIEKPERVFYDRGILDYIAFLREDIEEDYFVYNHIKTINLEEPYDGVFLIENIGKVQKEAYRKEDLVVALEQERKIEHIYKNFGYTPIRIPNLPLKERVDLIMKHVRDYEIAEE